MAPRRSKKFEGLDLEPAVATAQARSLRNRTIKTETSPCSGELSIVPVSEPTIADATPGDNTRSLRSRTVKTDASPCSGQLSIVHISEPAIANGTPGDNTRSLRSRTVKTNSSSCSGQLSIMPVSEPTIAKGTPGDNTRSLRSRTIKTSTSPCSGQLPTLPIYEPTIAKGTTDDNTRSLRSRTIKTNTTPCPGQLSTVPISEPAIVKGIPGDNTRSLRGHTIKTDTSPSSGQLSTLPISEPAIAKGTPGDNTRSLRSRTIKTDTSSCAGQLSTVPTSEPTIAKGTPDDNTRSLRSRKVKTSPCSGQLSIVAISEPIIANGTPGDNTRSLRSRTVKTETPPSSSQLSIVPISEPSISITPGDNIEEQVKLTEEGLPEGWIKEVKLPGNVLRRKHTFYVDPKTGYAFHSLEDALQYAQTGSVLSCVIIPQKRSEEELLALMNSPEVDTPCQMVKTHNAKSSSQVSLCLDGSLPEDWIKEEKSRKKDSNKKDMFYIDPKTGYAFHSLKDALRYIETGDIVSCAVRPQKRSMEEIRILSNHTNETESSASPSRPSKLINDEKSGDNVCEVVQEGQLNGDNVCEVVQEGQLNGDNVCEVVQEGQLNGDNVCEVVQEGQLNGDNVCEVVQEGQLNGDNVCEVVQEGQLNGDNVCEVVQEGQLNGDNVREVVQEGQLNGDNVREVVQEGQLTSCGLPKSWIKELRPRKDGIKMDPFYVDPDTGYAFLSLKDALRYVATGNIRSCIVRPRKRSIEEVQALISSSEISSISGMKTVQQESLQLVQHDSLPRKRKRSSMKSSDRKLGNSKIKGDGATGTVSPRVRKRKEVPSRIRASPRLLALKTKIMTDCGENHEESTDLYNAVHDACSQPDLKPEEEAMAENGNSMRTQLQSKKPRKGPMPISTSPSSAAPETKADNASLENKNGRMSISVLEPVPSSQPCLNSQPSCHPAAVNVATDAFSVEHDNGMTSNVLIESSPSSLSYEHTRLTSDLGLEENMELANNSCAKAPSRRGKMHRERRTTFGTSSRPAWNAASSVVHENGMTSNALIGLSPSSLSYENTRLTRDLERKEKIELEHKSSANETSRREKVQRELRKLLRASSHRSVQKVTTDITSTENKKIMMNNAPKESSPSLAHLNLGSTSQPNLVLKEETIEQTSNSLTKKPSCGEDAHREKQTPLRASSFSAQNVTNDADSVQNENNMTSNALFGPLPSSLPYQNLRPSNQPDLELKEEIVEKVNSSLMETPLCRGKVRREKPMCKASSHLATMDAINDATSIGNENRVTNNAFSNPSPAFSLLNMTPASHPDLEIKSKIQAANVISTGTSLQRGEKNTEKPMHFSSSSHQAALKQTTNCSYEENEDENITSSIFETRPPFNPDLNFGSTSLPDLDLKEEQIQTANVSSTGTSLQSGKKRTRRPMPVPAYSYQSAPKPVTDCTSRENEDGNVTNPVFDRLLPCHPDLNLGSTSLPDMDAKEERITVANARGSRTIFQSEKLLEKSSSTIIKSSHLSTPRPNSGITSPENQMDHNKASYAVSELPLSPARPDLNFGPTSQPYREPMEDAIAAVNDSGIRTTSWRVEPRREVPTCVDASPRLEALKVNSERASSKSNNKNSMSANALSEQSHYPGRPDLNLGPTSQLAAELQKEIASDSTPGNPLWRRNLHGVKPTPAIAMTHKPTPAIAMTHKPTHAVAMTQAPFRSYENSIKISNYFCSPVDSPASHVNRGSTGQPNPGEVWHDTTAAAPSTLIAEGKTAPDLNMVPMSWSEPEYNLERALKTNPGPKLEQQQQPVGVNTIGEFHLQSPVPSEMPYQDPTMDALLSGQDPGPSMPHMSIDALNSPVSPFFGDFWHDPCLSYAFKTLTGGVNQQQGNLGLGPENNVNWTGTRNGGPSENPSIGSNGTTSRTPQYMNHGTPQQYLNHGTPQQYMNHGTPQQYMNHGTPQQVMNHGTPQQVMNHGTPQQVMNHGTPQYMNRGIPQYMNPGNPQYMINGTPQHMINGTPQHMNNGTLQHINNGMPQYMNNGMRFQK